MVLLALQRFKDQCQNQTVLVATDNSTVEAYINRQEGTNSAEMCALLWKIMTWCHHYHNSKSQAHSRAPECDGRPSVQVEPSPFNRMVTASGGVKTDLSRVVQSSCRSICQSSEPQSSFVCFSSLGHNALNINWSGLCLCLPTHGSPSQGDSKNQAMQLPNHCNIPRLARDALVLGPSAAVNKDPTPVTSVNNTSQTVPQLCVSQQSATFQPPRLVSRSGQLQEQGFSVEVVERIAAPQTSLTRTIYKSKWALFEKWYRKFGGFLNSHCETSLRPFHVPVPRSKQAPFNH